MNRVHTSRDAARAALGEAGYKSGFSSPGRPELWIKGQSRVAVARRVLDADEQWLIVAYPEPATATSAQVIELAKRDGVVLSAGKFPSNDATMNTETAIEEDPDADLL